jgi:YD repeat-containing protein
VTFPGSRTVSYGYSNVGNRSSITYPGGSNQVAYGYDAANNLTSVTDWNSQQTTYAYNNAGYLTTVTIHSGTGVVGTYGYDNADRLTSVSWVKGGSTLASATYTLDNVGNRTQRVDQLGTHTYGYDNLYRLTSVTYPGPSTDSYTYDAVGNRLSKNAPTYDAAGLAYNAPRRDLRWRGRRVSRQPAFIALSHAALAFRRRSGRSTLAVAESFAISTTAESRNKHLHVA